MNPKAREYADLIQREVEEWPGVTVTFTEEGKHPKAKLVFGGKTLSRPFSGTSGDSSFGRHRMLGDMRRTMRQLGAARSKPEPTEEEADREYRKPNDGAEKRPPAVKAEPVEQNPDIAEQLAPIAKVAAQPHDILPEKEVEYLGPGEWDIPEDRYHADPCETPSLSASIAKKLIDLSPLHAWTAHPRLNVAQENEEKKSYDLGSAFHKLVLGKGAEIVVLDYADFKKQAAKDERDNCYANGQIPLLAATFEAAEAMVAAARWQMRGNDDLALAMSGGAPERVLIWEESTPAGPIMCRAMVDWLPSRGPFVPDWKSTAVSAGPDGWGARTMWDLSADVQEAFYLRGLKKVLGRDFQAMIFAVTETKAPHALGVHAVVPPARAMAERKVQYAINVWGMCMHHNRWPAYGNQTFWQSPPPWHEGKWLEREENGSVDLEELEAHMARLASMKDIAAREGAEVTDANPFGFSPVGEGA